MFSVGEKLRPAVGGILAGTVETGHGLWRAARVRHTEKGSPGVGSEQNGAVAAPGAAATHRGVAKGQRGTAGSVNAVELAVSIEGQIAAVGRPEGITRVVRASEGLRHARIEWEDPEELFALRVPGNEGEALAIGREDGNAATIACDCEGVVRGRDNLRDDGGRGRLLAPGDEEGEGAERG